MGGGPNFGSERTFESPHPLPVVTEKATDDYVFLNLWKPVAVGPGNTQTTKGTQRQSHFWISLEFSLVAKYNTRFIKKFSQLNSDIQTYCYKDFSLKQVSGLMGEGGLGSPRVPPLLWCPLISFLQHSVIRTNRMANYRCAFWTWNTIIMNSR